MTTITHGELSPVNTDSRSFLLERVQPSPIVALNRAVAVAMADGPKAALALVEQLAASFEKRAKAQGATVEALQRQMFLERRPTSLLQRFETAEGLGDIARLDQHSRLTTLSLRPASAARQGRASAVLPAAGGQ